jgi:hypothetical protein
MTFTAKCTLPRIFIIASCDLNQPYEVIDGLVFLEEVPDDRVRGVKWEYTKALNEGM